MRVRSIESELAAACHFGVVLTPSRGGGDEGTHTLAVLAVQTLSLPAAEDDILVSHAGEWCYCYSALPSSLTDVVVQKEHSHSQEHLTVLAFTKHPRT